MKTVLILAALPVAFLVLLLHLRGISGTGSAPGLTGGLLARCPDSPNCVCSEQADDAGHYLAPLLLPHGVTSDTLPLLKSTIQDMGGSIQSEDDCYLAATFSSAFFGFVDDLEIRLDPAQKTIHVRSASRVGYSDLGVNKKRVKLFKKLFNNRLSEAGRQ